VGARAAPQLVGHFHGTQFTGLIGGAVEVDVRHQGWLGCGQATTDSVPRLTSAKRGDPSSVCCSRSCARFRTRPSSTAWQRTLVRLHHRARAGDLGAARADLPAASGEFGSSRQHDSGSDPGQVSATQWQPACYRRQARYRLAARPGSGTSPVRGTLRKPAVRVHQPHRQAIGDGSGVPEFTQLVRAVIADTNLAGFFDARALQTSDDWQAVLRENVMMSHY